MRYRFPSIALSALLAAFQANAQTTATDAWVRGTVAQQKTTGLFVKLTSVKGGQLVSASSPVSRVAEVHVMSMKGDVMTMRQVPALDLPAGKTVSLEPNGAHVMLIDLKQALKAGDIVPVTLVIEDRDKKRETLDVNARVEALGAPHDEHAGMKMN
jgi:copper(I)-binding protein